jgi:hypothetical protein
MTRINAKTAANRSARVDGSVRNEPGRTLSFGTAAQQAKAWPPERPFQRKIPARTTTDPLSLVCCFSRSEEPSRHTERFARCSRLLFASFAFQFCYISTNAQHSRQPGHEPEQPLLIRLCARQFTDDFPGPKY